MGGGKGKGGVSDCTLTSHYWKRKHTSQSVRHICLNWYKYISGETERERGGGEGGGENVGENFVRIWEI